MRASSLALKPTVLWRLRYLSEMFQEGGPSGSCGTTVPALLGDI